MPALLALLPLLQPLLDRFIPDPRAREQAVAELTAKMLEVGQAQDAAQAATNTAEAQTGNIFIGGWRPAVGWVCALALAWAFVVGPVAIWLLTVAGHTANLPPTGMSADLWELVFAMLGLGGLRTFEKMRGVAAGTPANAPRTR